MTQAETVRIDDSAAILELLAELIGQRDSIHMVQVTNHEAAVDAPAVHSILFLCDGHAEIGEDEAA